MIVLSDKYQDHVRARAVPGAFFDRERRAWCLEHPTPRAAVAALRIFPHLLDNDELVDARNRLAQDVRPLDRASEFGVRIEAPRVAEALRARGSDFYRFQAIDLGYVQAVLEEHGAAYLGWERGLGKSIGAAALIDSLDAGRVLIVAPNSAKRAVWEAELSELCPWLNLIVLRNSKPQRKRDLAHVQQLRETTTPHALIVHYEALSIIGEQRADGKGWQTLGQWDIVIADEAHRISNPKTKMSRAIKKIPTRYKLALSGSIIQNHAEEMFSQLQWLYPDRYRSRWRDWNDRFLDYIESGYGRICVGVKIERLEEMRNELGVFMVHRRKEDELDLPPRVDETRYVEMSPAQATAYSDLQETYLTQLDNGEVVKATDGLVLLTRLRQVASGLDLFSDELADSTKCDLAMDLITDNPDEAFAVFSWFKASARSIARRCEAAGIETFLVTGDTKPDDRAKHIAAFQGGQRRVFIGTIKTLGESVNLSRASSAVFIDRSWNPADNLQAGDRIYRIGQHRPVTVTTIVARGTVDELRVTPVIHSKDQLRRMILGA